MEYEIGQANRLGNRSSNQDRFAAFESNGTVLLALADGMGGRAGGELAAEAFVAVAKERFYAQRGRVAEPERFFKEVILRTHHHIHRLAERDQRPAPGTTGVLCLIQNSQASWAHIGDSRFYLFRDGLPLYRTQDHSLVECLYQSGTIEFSEKSRHPRRNQITQCIGYLPQEPEMALSKPIALVPGDVLLLCSDGLWGGLDDAQLGAMLQEQSDLDTVVNRMAEAAEKNCYPQSDNISVLALRAIACDDELDGLDLRIDLEKALRPDVRAERLEEAIERIEEVIRKYQNEMKS